MRFITTIITLITFAIISCQSPTPETESTVATETASKSMSPETPFDCEFGRSEAWQSSTSYNLSVRCDVWLMDTTTELSLEKVGETDGILYLKLVTKKISEGSKHVLEVTYTSDLKTKLEFVSIAYPRGTITIPVNEINEW